MDNHHFRLSLLFFLVVTPTLVPHTAAQQPSDSTGDNLNTNNVSPSMAVIVIVLVVAFFITGSVSIYIQQCTNSSTPSTFPIIVGGVAGRVSRRGQPRGLEKSVIDTFPTFAYSAVKELKIGKGSLECAVCLNEFEDEETLRLLPKCDHVFHSDCIDAWLAGHNTCPVCRANLVPEQPNSAEWNHPTTSDDMPGTEMPSSSGDERREVRMAINDYETTAAPKRNPEQKLPRSHSTGHSLSRPEEEEWDRFTLRLPTDVRRQLVERARLKRATSMVALPRASCSRRGYRRNGDGEGSGSSRYGRLFNFLFPPFVSRGGSVRSTAKAAIDTDGITPSFSSKRSALNVVTPLDSLPSLPV